MVLDSGRQYCRIPIPGSCIVQDIERTFPCMVSNLSLGGAYLLVGNSIVLGGIQPGDEWQILIQGIGEAQARIVRKDGMGVGVQFRDRPDQDLRGRLASALTRELRHQSDDFIINWFQSARGTCDARS
jgi:hypothetical protein